MKKSDVAAAFLGASIDVHIPVIDLHLAGSLETALYQLEHELDKVSRAGVRYCRVVHGIGSGVLTKSVHNILAKNKQTIGFQEEENGGSCVVLF